MIRNHFLLIILLFFLTLCHGSAWAGQEIAAVQSIRVQPYEEAINGFKSVCDVKITRLVTSELKGTDIVERIKEIGPDMVLAVGPDALAKVKRIKNIPVVYLMVLNPQSILAGEKNFSGVGMNIPQEKQLRALLDVLPEMKSVGLLYDPDRTGHLVEKAREAAGKIGIKLVAKEVRSSRSIPQLMQDMKGKIDVFWMLPDLTVITPETVEFMLLFSLENKIPILTFSEKYLESGAFMSIGIDAFDMGKQAGQMAAKMLSSGRDGMHSQNVDAREMAVSINLKVAGKLGITIDEKIIGKVRTIK